MLADLAEIKSAIVAVAETPAHGDTASSTLESVMQKLVTLGANTNARMATLIGQCSVESFGFSSLTEDLRYSAERLEQVFPADFRHVSAADYAYQPQKIANLIYANRMGNGDTASGDGFRYRGRGWIQLTGKYNYQHYAPIVGEDLTSNPDLAAEPNIAWLIAVAFMANTSRGGKTLLEWADSGNQTEVTLGINGGVTGLSAREVRVKKAAQVLASGSGTGPDQLA
ncbi:MAG: glycoside hydrolase family 19 protein [Pseudomonadota bacterium]